MYEKTEQLSDDETKGRDYAVVTGDFSDVESKEVKRKSAIMIVDRCW